MKRVAIKRFMTCVITAAVVLQMPRVVSADTVCREEKITFVDAEEEGDMPFSEQELEWMENETNDSAITDARKKASGNSKVIVLDPGHGGNDGGAFYQGVREADLNLKIAQYAKAELEQYLDVKVYLTRSDNTYLELQQRVDYAVSMSADALVSIHLNAYSKDTSVNGACVYYQNGNYNSTVSGKSLNLANSLLSQITSLGIKNNGVKIRNSENNTTYPDGSLADYYGILRISKLAGLPAVITEHAYLSCKSDYNNYLNTDAKLQALGIKDATAIANYFGLEKPVSSDVNATRIGGDTRVDTAIACADVNKTGQFSSVVLAYAYNFPDALSGTTLASVNGAPILLVGDSAEDRQKIYSYLQTNLVAGGTVYTLGGEAVIPSEVTNTLTSYGFNIVRYGGATRYDTNMQIINAMNIAQGTDVVIATGGNYADCVSISGVAGRNGMPIFLVDGSLTQEALEKIYEIQPNHIYIIGQEAAVSREVESQVAGVGSNVTRIGGVDRYATSMEIVNRFYGNGASAVVVAYGNNFPDALTGGVFAAKYDFPILIVNSENNATQHSYIKNHSIKQLFVMGYSNAVSDTVVNNLRK